MGIIRWTIDWQIGHFFASNKGKSCRIETWETIETFPITKYEVYIDCKKCIVTESLSDAINSAERILRA